MTVNVSFLYQTLEQLNTLLAKASQHHTEYKGYFEEGSSGTDLLMEADSRCTRDRFMDLVTKSINDGGCGAEKRSMDLSDIFGDKFCNIAFDSYTYIIKYGSVDSEFKNCVCDALKKVDSDCTQEYWEIIGIAVGSIVGIVLVGAAIGGTVYGIKKSGIIEKTADCFGSIKNNVSSFFNSCANSGAEDAGVEVDAGPSLIEKTMGCLGSVKDGAVSLISSCQSTSENTVASEASETGLAESSCNPAGFFGGFFRQFRGQNNATEMHEVLTQNQATLS